MAKLGVVLIALLGVCCGGHAEDSPDLSSLVFSPRPPSSPPLAIVSGEIGPTKASEAAGTGGSSDPDDARSDATRARLRAAVERRLDAVSKEEGRNGERSPALIDRLASLAAAYRAIGEYDSAIGALEDARNVVRINSGLFSLDQAPVVESLIANREAKGEYGEVAKQREYLRNLVHANPDDTRIVGVLTTLARSEMDSARRLLDVPASPVVAVTSGPIGSSDAPSRKPSLQALYGARSDYIDAIRASVKLRTGNTGDLFALEDALVDTVYFEFAHPELDGQHRLSAGSRNFAHPGSRRLGAGAVPLGPAGARILQGKVLDSINFGLPPKAVAEALIELGDWLLACSQNGAALSEYQAAHDVLVEGKVPAETIGAILSPQIPRVVPVLPVAVAGSEQGGPYRGYVDAKVKLTRFGDAKSLVVLDESPGTSRAVERHLRRYVSSLRFRPRFVGGEPARSDEFKVRYYFAY